MSSTSDNESHPESGDAGVSVGIDHATSRDGSLLVVDDLWVQFGAGQQVARALDGVSFSIERGRALGIVGESGSGKSVTARAIMRLLSGSEVAVGASTLRYRDIDLLAASESEMRRIRGSEIAIVFQEPMASLNPVLKIGDQVTEARRVHQGLSRRTALREAASLLRRVDLSEPEVRARQYPHNLSGGMRQRVMIAAALSCDPGLLILDEPTTALDVTVQAQILDLVREQLKGHETALLLITHDLGVISQMVDDVAVMYAGRIVEYGPVGRVLASPQHPYTEALIAAMPANNPRGTRLKTIEGSIPNSSMELTGCNFRPRCGYRTDKCAAADPRIGEEGLVVACWNSDQVGARPRGVESARPPAARSGRQDSGVLLRAEDVSKTFAAKTALGKSTGGVRVVDAISFEVQRGEVLGLVGESGCGKTTLAKMLAGLEAPTSGRIEIDGSDVSMLSRRRGVAAQLRRDVQFVFQDPYGSLNPRMTIGTILAESLRANADRLNQWKSKTVRHRAIEKALDAVGLDPSAAQRYPHEFSGGQRQRVAIARALILEPKLVICDEPVSALDVSVQGQILNLLADLRSTYDLALVFIAHDLAVIEHVSDRIAVMYLGQIVEIGTRDEISQAPKHPYTTALLSAAPVALGAPRERIILSGEIPSPSDPPPGCRFHTRCWLRSDLGGPAACVESAPELRGQPGPQLAACHFSTEVGPRTERRVRAGKASR